MIKCYISVCTLQYYSFHSRKIKKKCGGRNPSQHRKTHYCWDYYRWGVKSVFSLFCVIVERLVPKPLICWWPYIAVTWAGTAVIGLSDGNKLSGFSSAQQRCRYCDLWPVVFPVNTPPSLTVVVPPDRGDTAFLGGLSVSSSTAGVSLG